MNKLKGHIVEIHQEDRLSLIKIDVNQTLFTSIIIEDLVPKFKLNQTVELLFKATEVIISKEENPNISLQNKIDCKIIQLKTGELLSDLTLDFFGTKIHSIITTQSVERLNLAVNQNITAMVKTNEIMLALC